MKWIVAFLRDTRHLWVLTVLLVAVGAIGLKVRSDMVPESFGQLGPYRADALTEIAAKPSVYFADSVCHECHTDVEEERTGTLHVTVRCWHCHGIGREHVAQARAAAESSDATIDPAESWDGDFETEIDLFIARDRLTCLVCHESKVGMPADVSQIVVAEHLEEQGAFEPESAEVCFECHGWHDTAP